MCVLRSAGELTCLMFVVVPTGTVHRTEIALAVPAIQTCGFCERSTPVAVRCFGVSNLVEEGFHEFTDIDEKRLEAARNRFAGLGSAAARDAALADAPRILRVAKCVSCGRRPAGALVYAFARAPGRLWWFLSPLYALCALASFGTNAATIVPPSVAMILTVHSVVLGVEFGRSRGRVTLRVLGDAPSEPTPSADR